MAENKTKVTEQSVDSFLEKTTDGEVRKDCNTLIDMMERVSGEPAKMWGASIVGFGQYHYQYESGREGDICLVGFSPRKGNISLYVKANGAHQEGLLSKLGKFKAGKGCIYIKKVSDINMDTLENITRNTIRRFNSPMQLFYLS